MVTTRIYATSDRGRAKAEKANGAFPVLLFESGSPKTAGLGKSLLKAVTTLPSSPSMLAWDFLAFSTAVFAADRFVLRSEAADGWTRVIHLEVELSDPATWEPHSVALGQALQFLTGDLWTVTFSEGGIPPPTSKSSTCDRDCICLFSGGLDSLIGALDLLSAGRSPLLASQASPKEGPVQKQLAAAIGLASHRFEGRVSERYIAPYEPSSRARSILFFAYGVVAASTLPRKSAAPITVYVPENGLIAINPPLTFRRVGSLSTRTTHPHFLSSIQAVLDAVHMGVRLSNPYEGKTKGEMLRECSHPALSKLAHLSYSCGKGKRLNQHCGRCVPCLIRRAAMARAGIRDRTGYFAPNLALQGENDDVAAVRLATAGLGKRDVNRWAAMSGPLPYDPARRSALVDVVERGLRELKAFVGTVMWS